MIQKTPIVDIHIASRFQGFMTYRDLLQSSFIFGSDLSKFLQSDRGDFFRIRTQTYYLSAGLMNNTLYLKRNSNNVEFSLDSLEQKDNYITVRGVILPDKLIIYVFDKSSREAVASGTDESIVYFESTQTIETIPTFPPNSLINWARENDVAPKMCYSSTEEFYEVVTNSFQSIQDKIIQYSVVNPFWDITYDGKKIIDRVPKREPDILPTIRALVSDIAITKKFKIYPEYLVAGGSLDFLIEGTLRTGKSTNVCIEFKHAHSLNLEHGLTKQLPEYMKAQGCDYGIYCVMFFKGRYFEQPANHSISSIVSYLYNIALKHGLMNIKIVVLDCSFPIPPSKK